VVLFLSLLSWSWFLHFSLASNTARFVAKYTLTLFKTTFWELVDKLCREILTEVMMKYTYVVLQCAAGKFDAAATALAAVFTASAAAGSQCCSASHITGRPFGIFTSLPSFCVVLLLI